MKRLFKNCPVQKSLVRQSVSMAGDLGNKPPKAPQAFPAWYFGKVQLKGSSPVHAANHTEYEIIWEKQARAAGVARIMNFSANARPPLYLIIMAA